MRAMCIIVYIYGIACGMCFLCVMRIIGALLPLSLSHFIFQSPSGWEGKAFLLSIVMFPAAVTKYSDKSSLREKGLLIPVSRSW